MDMKQVCCYLTEEFKIRPYLRSDHIALSCVHSWFRDQEGITIPLLSVTMCELSEEHIATFPNLIYNKPN